MNFNSLVFLIFLPVVVGGYWLLRGRVGKLWLLSSSYFFYMYANPALILLLLISTFVDFFCSNGIERCRNCPKKMKMLLLTSIFVNLGLLFTFIYFDFFAQNINLLCAAVKIPYRVPELGLILPVGISFYTFQTMSYTIDVYRGAFHAERDPLTFALYVTFFPKLVAGPIESPSNLLPQLRQEHSPCREDFPAGVRLLLCGFFRKCAVADLCGIFANRVFAAADQANALAIACAGGLFCIQMYCDFAGYSEIAAGAARLMGIRLMRIFDPSLSVPELRRVLPPVAHQPEPLVYQLCVHPAGRQQERAHRKAAQHPDCIHPLRFMARARWTYVLWGLYAALWVCLERKKMG